ncbi:MAG: NIPSNAP family protein [Gemmatimonadaceae bacterium]|nr:NIPSNAP family protein [Chitinophagaceae bacterium]
MRMSTNFILAFFCLTGWSLASNAQRTGSTGEYYQITVYHCNSSDQLKSVEDYLQNAYLPALHRLGMSQIGVFKPHGVDTVADKKVFVLLTARNLDLLAGVPARLLKDRRYQKDGASLISAPWDKPSFARIENILLRSFRLAPVMKKPQLKSDRSERVYELRSYESPSEKIFQNKVDMFNEGGEIALFARLGFNAIFYGEVISGSHMPNLMYITSFENRVDRDAHWKAFGADAQWKELSARPEFQKNVSKNEQTFLYPTQYSDY